jgi:hypothetical protein
MSEQTKEFCLKPRDPLVLGDGRPLERQRSVLWPQPATLAAAVNGWGAMSPGQTGIPTLRGPLLWGPVDKGGNKFGLWVPPPADVRVREGVDAVEWLPAKPTAATHTFLPPTAPRVTFLIRPSDVDEGGAKCKPLNCPIPLTRAIDWSLAQGSTVDERVWTDSAEGANEREAQAVRRWKIEERRIHVVRDDERGTAVAGGLFRTAGTRLPERFSYCFSLRGGRPLLAGASEGRMVQLGGESRMADLTAASDLFPIFPVEKYRQAAPLQGYLRLQLVTPGWFGDERQGIPLIEGLNKSDLRVVAACFDRYQAFSGWKHTTPRAVRRVVPAGAVYWIGQGEKGQPLERKELLDLAEALFLQPLPAGQVGSTNPARLGYNICLPGFTAASHFPADK